VSIGYSFNRIKMYLDGILVVDGAMSLKPKNVSLFGKTYDFRENSNRKTLIKDIKIATGRASLYNGIAINGKYESNTITFDKQKPYFKSTASGEIKKI